MIEYYLYFGLVSCIVFYIVCVIEDIVTRFTYRRLLHSKFGYNYKNPIIWWMSVILAIPIINVIWSIMWIFLSIRYWYHFKFKGLED